MRRFFGRMKCVMGAFPHPQIVAYASLAGDSESLRQRNLSPLSILSTGAN